MTDPLRLPGSRVTLALLRSVLLPILLPVVPLSAQDEKGGADPAASPQRSKADVIGDAILHWVSDFASGDIRIQGGAHVAPNSPLAYVRQAVEGGVFDAKKQHGATTHFTLLQRLVGLAEMDSSRKTAHALLALASTGFARDMFNPRLMMIRDLGHFALMRIDDPAVWAEAHEIAVKEIVGDADSPDVPVRGVNDAHIEPDARAMWRVAAIRLLGMKKKGVFRTSIEKCLVSSDSRVRLAAAESLGFMHSKGSLSVLTRALPGETHPMVFVAIVQSLQQILNKHAVDIPEATSELALRTSLGMLGKNGWRGDMAIVQLIHNHPFKPAVPKLISLMRQSRGEVDPILKIVNKNASRFLGMEAHRALRRVTGAIVADDPDKWEQFWEENEDKIVIQRRGPADKSKTFAVTSGGSFYGIPVLGCEVVFVIDTSGSMKHKVTAKVPAGKGTRTARMRGSRLSVARRQTLKAIQGMPKHARFSIVTFDSNVRAWNRKPVEAGRNSRRTAAQILGKLRPKGGTNAFDALVLVLEGKEMGYGEKSKTNVDEIFVLSDGQPNGDAEEILRVVREINAVRKVRIHAVFAGDGSGADFMRRLAEENGGVFVKQ